MRLSSNKLPEELLETRGWLLSSPVGSWSTSQTREGAVYQSSARYAMQEFVVISCRHAVTHFEHIILRCGGRQHALFSENTSGKTAIFTLSSKKGQPRGGGYVTHDL